MRFVFESSLTEDAKKAVDAARRDGQYIGQDFLAEVTADGKTLIMPRATGKWSIVVKGVGEPVVAVEENNSPEQGFRPI